MRAKLKDLIRSTIAFRYKLPNNELIPIIPKINHSTQIDHCYASESHDELVNIIYNAIIEYSFSVQEISLYDYQSLHSRALKSKLRYNEYASEHEKLSYGFYGEILLDCILKSFFYTGSLIARGFFYNPLENSETKGFDCFHIIENTSPELWFGEAKFYGDYKGALEQSLNSVMNKIEVSLSDEYLKRNLIALCEEEQNFDSANKDLKDIVKQWKENPDIDILKLLKEKRFKLVYPILILFDDLNSDYDSCVRKAVNYLNNIKEKHYSLSIQHEIFFILVPLSKSQQIKKDVIKCISDKKPLL